VLKISLIYSALLIGHRLMHDGERDTGPYRILRYAYTSHIRRALKTANPLTGGLRRCWNCERSASKINMTHTHKWQQYSTHK